MKKLEIYRKVVWGPFKKYICSKLSIFLTSLPQADPDPFFKPVYQLGRQNSNGKLKWNFYILITKNKKGYFFFKLYSHISTWFDCFQLHQQEKH